MLNAYSKILFGQGIALYQVLGRAVRWSLKELLYISLLRLV